MAPVQPKLVSEPATADPPIAVVAEQPVGQLPESTASKPDLAAATAAVDKPAKIKSAIKETVELILTTALLLILIRWGLGEPRYIPSSSMEPTFLVNDRIIVEKLTSHLGMPINRGDILVFYPPPQVTGGKDLSSAPLAILGRMTGLPFLPNETAYIKRVIGLPGNRIEIKKGVGVFIDGKLLDEPYVKAAADYDLSLMGDIGGRAEGGSGFVKPFGDSNDPIIVPAGHLFMMGDNRNASADSHVWGFLDQKRVIGRAWILFWRFLEPSPYLPPIE